LEVAVSHQLPDVFELERSQTAVAVIDIQERLAAAMPPEVLAVVTRNTNILLRGAVALGLPVVVTEQYPKGLGPTLESIELPEGTQLIEKIEFSAAGAEGFVETLRSRHIKHVLLAGMEAHVCVLQTVIDLADAGFHTWILRDAVCSRTKASWRIGLSLAERAGGLIATTETALFLLLGRAGTPEFKAISQLVK
jgi:nicotinamidase-related amidase